MKKDEKIKILEDRIKKQNKDDNDFKTSIENRSYDKTSYKKLKEIIND